MTSSDLPEQVRAFLIQKTGAKVASPADDCVLVGGGLIDSFGLVSLLADVESKFGVFPDLMNHDPGDYSTLKGLTRIILLSLGVSSPSESSAIQSEVSESHGLAEMTAATRIERLSAGHVLWPSLPALFKDMFAHFATTGVRLPLVDGGEHLWIKSIEALPEKVFYVAGVIENQMLQGFITGQMKLLPAFLGGGWVGEVSYLYVLPAARQRGLAAGLAGAATEWFRERGARSIELQVLTDNTGAQAFWRTQDFQPELTQFRRHL